MTAINFQIKQQLNSNVFLEPFGMTIEVADDHNCGYGAIPHLLTEQITEKTGINADEYSVKLLSLDTYIIRFFNGEAYTMFKMAYYG